MNQKLFKSCRKCLSVAEEIGLIIIALATIIAVSYELYAMFEAQKVTLADLLLLFIYLEVIAMVAVYLESGKLPIRMPLYIGIVALARYLILDIKSMDNWRILSVALGTLILAVTILIIRYGHMRFSYGKERTRNEE